MPDPPPHDDAAPQTPEAQFLSALWDTLERAMEVSTSNKVMSQLDEVERLCEDAAKLIRRWRERSVE